MLSLPLSLLQLTPIKIGKGKKLRGLLLCRFHEPHGMFPFSCHQDSRPPALDGRLPIPFSWQTVAAYMGLFVGTVVP